MFSLGLSADLPFSGKVYRARHLNFLITRCCSFPDTVANHAMAPWPSRSLPLCSCRHPSPRAQSSGSQAHETRYLKPSSSHSQIMFLFSSSEQHTLFPSLFGLGIPNSFDHSSSFLEIILELQSAISSQSTTIDSSFFVFFLFRDTLRSTNDFRDISSL